MKIDFLNFLWLTIFKKRYWAIWADFEKIILVMITHTTGIVAGLCKKFLLTIKDIARELSGYYSFSFICARFAFMDLE